MYFEKAVETFDDCGAALSLLSLVCTLGQNPTFYPEITKNLMFENVNFVKKCDFENVNFVKMRF